MRYIIELEGEYNDVYVWRTFPRIKFIGDERYALAMEYPQALRISEELKGKGLYHHLRPHRTIPIELTIVSMTPQPM